MAKWKSGVFAIWVVILLSGACGKDPFPGVLVQEGLPVTISRASHAILLEPDASPSEEHAARELRAGLEACLGGEFPIHRSLPREEIPLLVLGCGPQARRLGVVPQPAALGGQGFLLRTVSPHIVIAGTRQAGTLYGVHRFLERFAGVRWYAPGVSRFPAVEELTVPAQDRVERPAFLWRHTSYAWPGRDEAFLTRKGDNSGSGDADHPYGIQISHDGRAHSYFTYISPGEFFDSHPEYFSEIGGVRVRDNTQLCLSNPEVLEIVTQRMLQRMAARPHDSQHNFSQKDYYNYCQCGPCTEINRRYGTAGGTQFWFVNQLAERTSRVYPDKLIGTLAYMYTEEPPQGLAMHPNAAVWLCHMYPSCDSHPVATCPLNADYKRRALAWSGLTAHLYIWHYVTDFTHYYNPFPNLRALASDLRFYRDIGVEGIYLQGMGNRGGGGEFSLLRPYYGMRLLWNPDEDPEALIQDFLEGYYGSAREPLWEYIRMLHDKVEQENIHMHLYTNPAQGYLTDDVLNRARELFDLAEAEVAGDTELLERVRVARMPLTYAALFPRNGYEVVQGKVRWSSEIACVLEVLGFLDRMEKHGFQVVREVAGEKEYLLLLYALIKLGPGVHVIRNERLEAEVVPLMGGRALRITDRASGKCVTSYNVKENLFFPFCGGLEDRVGEGFEFYGWVEPNLITRRTPTAITLQSTTLDGFRLERTFSLQAGRPVLDVESVLTNTGDAPRRARFRSHLELDLGDLRSTRVSFTDRSGAAVAQDMTGIIAGLREGEHFYDQQAPHGCWTFSGTKGIEVTQRFDDEAIDYGWLYAYPETQGELEVEIWARRVDLGPGESFTFRQSVEVLAAE